MDMGGGSVTNHSGHGISGGGGGGGHMMAHMSFFWDHRADILFSGWPGDRQGVSMYVLALLLVFAASALVEFLSYLPRLSRGPTTTGKSLLLTAIAALTTGLSYLVMLAVMSFNVGVLIAAIVGRTLGFFVFGSGIFFRRGVAHQDILPNKC